MFLGLLITCFAVLAFYTPSFAAKSSDNLPQSKNIGTIEQVAAFTGPMLTGVSVSQSGRIFVNFPRWGDKVDFTVAEVKNGRAVAYPNPQINRPNSSDQSKSLVYFGLE